MPIGATDPGEAVRLVRDRGPPPPTAVALTRSGGGRASADQPSREPRAGLGRGFRQILDRQRARLRVTAEAASCVGAALSSLAARLDAGARVGPPPGPGESRGRAASVSEVARVWLESRRLEGTEARIQVTSGPLAGLDIRVVATGRVQGIEAQLLTGPGGLRETLAVAWDEIRARLRSRGVTVREVGGWLSRRHGRSDRSGER